MFEILFLIWLAASVLMTIVFCIAARRFVSEPDSAEEPANSSSSTSEQNPAIAVQDKAYGNNTPYVL